VSNKRKVKPRTGGVYIGYLHPADVSAAFHKSVVELMLFDALGPRRVVGGGGRYCSANVSNGRNGIVKDFLASPAEWLLMLDSDMMFDPTLIEDFLADADADSAPFVGGLCFGINDGALFPTLYGLERADDGTVGTIRYEAYPEDSLFQVAATGAACTFVHRRVYEAIAARQFNAAFPWYQETEMSGRPVGEDFTFCLRAGLCDFPVYVHTGIHVGHHKSHVLTAEMYQQQRAALIKEKT
jgi:GT2 family glycosyltransferase